MNSLEREGLVSPKKQTLKAGRSGSGRFHGRTLAMQGGGSGSPMVAHCDGGKPVFEVIARMISGGRRDLVNFPSQALLQFCKNPVPSSKSILAADLSDFLKIGFRISSEQLDDIGQRFDATRIKFQND